MDFPFKLVRLRAGLSQAAFGDRLNISQPAVSALDKGGAPSRETCLRTYEQFRLEMAQLELTLEHLLRNEAKNT